MAIRIPTNQIQNPQQLEAMVAGPDGANRLFIINGQLNVPISAFSQGPVATTHETFTVLLGPVLTRQQFFRSVCTASITDTGFNINTGNPDNFNNNISWRILNVDADWDDESGQVELRIEISVTVFGLNNSASINSVAFQVSILAAVAAA